jgi:hypothetical protein
MRTSVREIIARHAIAGVIWLPVAAALACADPAIPAAIATSTAPPDTVRIQLVFGAEVDLDLYVTGPGQETVYFGNDHSRDGGQLLADRRCDSPAPRVEMISFAPAAPGRYRIGVDFMVRCARGVDRAPYELYAEAPGQPPLRQRGEASFGAFEPLVLELEVGPAFK